MQYALDMPCHRGIFYFSIIKYNSMSIQSIVERPSLLSASSGYENYRGFLNLLYVILGIGSCRLVLENILQYGLLVEFDWPIKFIKDPTNWPSVCYFSFKLIYKLVFFLGITDFIS